MKTFLPGGIHPAQNKITAHSPIAVVELPRTIELLLSQNIGAPSTAVVAKGDKVRRGDLVADASGFVSAKIHTPISGTVTAVGPIHGSVGAMATAITIVADEEEHVADTSMRENPLPVRTDEEIAALEPAQIVGIVAEAGIVGLGGATFPTQVKLMPHKGLKADVLIVNGAECEPYLTCDHALMLEATADVMAGIALMMRAAGVDRALVGIENNKPDAIAAMAEVAKTYSGIEVVPLRTKYPQGSEKQLIYALTGRTVPSGALPINVGAVVQNVATCHALYRAVRFGQPLMERVVTITGKDVTAPGNYLIANGSKISNLIALAGGLPPTTGKVILGGPMMGRSIDNLEAPVTKGVSGILMMPTDESHRRPVEPCVRCAKCVDACPMGLEPYLISTLARREMMDECEAEKVMNCLECGSCSYVCPSSRPLLDYIKYGKMTVGARIRARKQNQNK